MVGSRKKIRVLIIDDSLLMRKMISSVLERDGDIEVVGVAVDAQDGREKIKQYNPDVVTLDVEMPGMDGLAFLEKIMTLRPMPVVMVSSLTQKGADATLRALSLGAVDYVPKITSNSFDVEEMGATLISKVKTAAIARVRPLKKHTQQQSVKNKWNEADLAPKLNKNRFIAIGASTGGVESITEVLSSLPSILPPIVITQHMPEKFTKSFASRLDGQLKLNVVEAKDGQVLESGKVYIAPGNYHLQIEKKAGGYGICRTVMSEPVSGHRPSVDVMFSSVAKNIGPKAIGVLLTGMGRDGALGLKEMREIGAYTIGQDEATSVVYGMPRAAFECGAVKTQLPLEKIADEIVHQCMQKAGVSRAS